MLHTCNLVPFRSSFISLIPSLWTMKPLISSQNMSTVQAFTHPENSKQQEGPPRIRADITVLTGRSRPPSMVSRLTKVLIYNWTDWDFSWYTAQINLWWKRGMLWRHIKSVSFTACSNIVRICVHVWKTPTVCTWARVLVWECRKVCKICNSA